MIQCIIPIFGTHWDWEPNCIQNQNQLFVKSENNELGMAKTHLQLTENSIQQDMWQLKLIKQCDKDTLKILHPLEDF